MPSRSDYISESTRRLVEKRASSHCEYCLIHEEDTYIGCEIDHIISIKHGGKNNDTNLAFSCLPCNRFKGTDIGEVTVKIPRINDEERLEEREYLQNMGLFPKE